MTNRRDFREYENFFAEEVFQLSKLLKIPEDSMVVKEFIERVFMQGMLEERRLMQKEQKVIYDK